MLSPISIPSICLALLALAPEINARPHRHVPAEVNYERVARGPPFAQMEKRQMSAAVTAPTGYNGTAVSAGFAMPTGSNYTFSGFSSTMVGKPNYGTAASTVTTTVSLYESYGSTAYKTLTTTICSAVISAFSTKFTVTDCDQTITFSTATATSTAAALAAATTAATPTTVISYYAAPWYSIGLVDPTEVTILSCAVDANGNTSNCQEILEIWEIRIVNVQLVSTSTMTMTQVFATPAVITMGSQVTSVSAGTYTFSTKVYETTTTTSSSVSTAAQSSLGAVSAVVNSNTAAYQVVSGSTITACSDNPTIMTTTLHSTVYDTQAIATVYLTNGVLATSYGSLSTTSFSTVFDEASSTGAASASEVYTSATSAGPVSVYSTSSTSSTEPTTTITLTSTITSTVTVTPTRSASGTAFSTGFIAPSGGNSTGFYPTASGAFRRRLF